MNTIVILAGGKSRRMGRDKLSLTMNGQTLLESAVSRFSAHYEHVYISVADNTKYPEISVGRVVDLHPGAGPLSGLHAALKTLPSSGVFLLAADLPFATPLAAKRITELCSGHDAAAVRLAEDKLEPLFGYYRAAMLPMCEEALLSGDYRMSQLLRRGDTRFIETSELGSLWDERLLLNVNYPGDYEKIINLS